MANPNVLGDTYVNGKLTMKSVTLPRECVGDGQIPAGADIDPLKLQHIHALTVQQPDGTAVVTRTQKVFVVAGASGQVLTCQASLTTQCTGAGTVTVDLQVGGVSVLSAPISFGSGDAAGSVKSQPIATAPLTQGQVVQVVVTATPGGGAVGQGLVAVARLSETPQ